MNDLITRQQDFIEKFEQMEKMELIDNQVRVKAQNFQSLLHRNPKENEIKINKQANNYQYLPISFLEMTLDEMFFSMWKTNNFLYHVIANEIVGSIELHVFHPVFKEWVSRVGAGAVMVQMRSKEKGGSGDITQIKDKYPNTLTKDFPHLKAECFRNACLSLGKSFGRDLNREFLDSYNPIIKAEENETVDELKLLTEKIIEKLSIYQGADKEEIKLQCQQARKENKFDLEFAKNIAQKLGIDNE